MTALFFVPLVALLLGPLLALILVVEALGSKHSEPKTYRTKPSSGATVHLRLPCLRVRTTDGSLQSCLLEAELSEDGIVCPVNPGAFEQCDLHGSIIDRTLTGEAAPA